MIQMTEQTTEVPEVSLAIIDQIDPKLVFVGGGLEILKAELTARLDEYEPDVDSPEGRKDIASFAYKFSRDKTLVDGIGKSLVAEKRAEVKQIDAKCKEWRDFCDQQRDTARQPLNEWEAAEKIRIEAEVLKREIERAEEDAHQLNQLYDLEKRENDRVAAETARLAEELLKQEALAKNEHEERIRQEAIAQAKKDAEEALIKAEQEKQAAIQAQKEAAAQAERDRVAAEAKAKADAEAARIQAEKDKAQAIEDAKRKAQAEADRKERERLAAEAKAKEEADRKAANKRHRNHVDGQAAESLIEAMQWDCEGDLERAMEVVRAISEGRVKHVTINY